MDLSQSPTGRNNRRNINEQFESQYILHIFFFIYKQLLFTSICVKRATKT